MFTAWVHGHVECAVKPPSLKGARMLIVQPFNSVTGTLEGHAQIAVDVLGAGLGSKVLVSGDGRGAQNLLGVSEECPVRLAIVGLLSSEAS